MFNLNYAYYKLPARYRFSLALMFFGVALIARFVFISQANGGAFITFYSAIILSFYFCGKVPGVMVSILSGLAGLYFFLPPYYQFSLSQNNYSPIIFFSITSMLIGVFISKLHRRIEEAHLILDNEMIGSMMLRQRKILWCNKAMSKILGYTQEELLGAQIKMLFADESTYEAVGKSAYPLKVGEPYRIQYEMRKADGNTIWVDVSGGAIPNDKSTSLWLVNDISKIKKFEDELNYKVDHDFLTGLHSRAWFMSHALIELGRSVRFNSPLSLLMLDIDFFKLVNDTYGHQTGDIVLKSIAELILTILRDYDVCARFGGEEFVILLAETNKDKAFEVAERLRLSIEQAKVTLPNTSTTLQLSVSIGLSYMTSKDDSIDELIRRADQSLYEAKKSGRNRVCTT